MVKLPSIADFIRDGQFEWMRQTYVERGWITDGHVMFVPTPPFMKRIERQKQWIDMRVNYPATPNLEPTLQFHEGHGTEAGLELTEGDNPQYLVFNFAKQGIERRVQFNPIFVDMILWQYPNARTYYYKQSLIFKIDGRTVGIVKGIVKRR